MSCSILSKFYQSGQLWQKSQLAKKICSDNSYDMAIQTMSDNFRLILNESEFKDLI